MKALLGACERWAKEHALDSLIGPFNLDYEDGYGILTDGRDRPPAILCGHTPAYYLEYITSLGFLPARPGNIAMAVDIETPPKEFEKLSRVASIARKKGRYRIRGARIKEWQDEAIIVHHLLNNSLGDSGEEAMPWPQDAVNSLVRPFLKIADPELVLFADCVSGPGAGTCVGWFAGVPNMNEILIHAGGLRYPWNYVGLVANLRRRPKCLAVKSLLVLPEHHSSGVAALLFDEMATRAIDKGYSWIDLSLTSEGNPETPVIAQRSGARVYKRYQIFRRPIV